MKHAFPPNVLHSMMRRKSLSYEQHSAEHDDGEHHHSLHRTLTAVDLMLYGVGCSVGAGIYCLVGIGAQLAGPAISLSFAICGSACIFTSLAYAEFAARIPLTGSAYVYAYVAFGEYWGWLVGWFLTLGYGFTASVVARSWGDYVASFARGVTGWSLASLTNFPVRGGYTCSPLSTVVVALCTWVLVSGAKESSRFNNLMTVLNISVLLFVVFAGSSLVEMDNLTPFAPQGIQGIAQGAGLVFFAFIGFDMVACLSEEVVQPEINMPIGIVGSLIISATIYVLVSLVVIGMAPIDLLGDKVPIVNALLANACCTHSQQVETNAAMECLSQTCTPVLHKVLAFGGRFVSFGAIFGLTTGTFTSLMGQPRIFYRMAQDGLLFEIFGIVNPNTRVPTGGILITGVISSLLACFIELESLANMISLGTLMVFTFVDAGVIILRWSPSTDTTSASRYDESDDEMDGINGSHIASLPPPHLYDEDGLQSSLQNWLVWFRGHDVKDNGMKPVVCTLLFTFSSLIASLMIGNHHFVAIMSATVAVVSGILLSILPQSPPPDTFSCPFVPLVPLIGIASNTVMMGSLPIGAWFFTLAWLVIGNAVYFLYGIRHSRLGKQQPPVRMLSLPETMPLTREGGELVLGSYESTTTNGDTSGSLEHRLHPSS